MPWKFFLYTLIFIASVNSEEVITETSFNLISIGIPFLKMLKSFEGDFFANMFEFHNENIYIFFVDSIHLLLFEWINWCLISFILSNLIGVYFLLQFNIQNYSVKFGIICPIRRHRTLVNTTWTCGSVRQIDLQGPKYPNCSNHLRNFRPSTTVSILDINLIEKIVTSHIYLSI